MGWEPPDPAKLLLSVARVQEELDIPRWKADTLCWSLGRRCVGSRVFVLRSALDEFKDLLDQGVRYETARELMWRRKGGAAPVTTGWSRSTGITTRAKPTAYNARFGRRSW